VGIVQHEAVLLLVMLARSELGNDMPCIGVVVVKNPECMPAVLAAPRVLAHYHSPDEALGACLGVAQRHDYVCHVDDLSGRALVWAGFVDFTPAFGQYLSPLFEIRGSSRYADDCGLVGVVYEGEHSVIVLRGPGVEDEANLSATSATA